MKGDRHFHNFNDHDYIVLEAFSPRNLVVMDMKSGSLTIALGATEYKRYPKDEEAYKGQYHNRGNRKTLQHGDQPRL